MVNLLHLISEKEECKGECYVKHVFQKVFKNSIKLKREIRHSKGTLRSLEWAFGHSRNVDTRAFETLGHSKSQALETLETLYLADSNHSVNDLKDV